MAGGVRPELEIVEWTISGPIGQSPVSSPTRPPWIFMNQGWLVGLFGLTVEVNRLRQAQSLRAVARDVGQ